MYINKIHLTELFFHKIFRSALHAPGTIINFYVCISFINTYYLLLIVTELMQNTQIGNFINKFDQSVREVC